MGSFIETFRVSTIERYTDAVHLRFRKVIFCGETKFMKNQENQPETVSAPDNAQVSDADIIRYFQEREQEREASGLNALMQKFEDARALGLDLDERDKTKLLALLLDDKLDGTGGYGIHSKALIRLRAIA